MAEEEGKVIQWPGGADEATDFDFLMVGKNNKPIMKIPKEKLNEVIVINGEGVKAVAGGASSSAPTILRPGPAGQNRKMEDVQGWFVNGTAAEPPVAVGEPWEAEAGNKNTNWWDGDTWSLGSSVALPKTLLDEQGGALSYERGKLIEDNKDVNNPIYERYTIYRAFNRNITINTLGEIVYDGDGWDFATPKFVPVKSGDVVRIKANSSNEFTNIISFYTNNNENSYKEGVSAIVGNEYEVKLYTYEVKEDGFIRCYLSDNNINYDHKILIGTNGAVILDYEKLFLSPDDMGNPGGAASYDSVKKILDNDGSDGSEDKVYDTFFGEGSWKNTDFYPVTKGMRVRASGRGDTGEVILYFSLDKIEREVLARFKEGGKLEETEWITVQKDGYVQSFTNTFFANIDGSYLKIRETTEESRIYVPAKDIDQPNGVASHEVVESILNNTKSYSLDLKLADFNNELGWIENDGGLRVEPNFKGTGYRYVSKGAEIVVKSYVSTFNAVAVYDINKTLITILKGTGDGLSTINYTMPKDGYIYTVSAVNIGDQMSVKSSEVTRKIYQEYTGAEDLDVGKELAIAYPKDLIYLEIFVDSALPVNKGDVVKGTCKITIGNLVFTKYLTLEIQGSSSTVYPKKNWTLKFFDDEDYNESFKMRVGDIVAHDAFVFKSNWIDATHVRNIVSNRMWEQIVQSRKRLPLREVNTPLLGKFGSDCYDTGAIGQVDGWPAELWINGGFYGIGCFNIGKKRDNYNLKKSNKKHVSITAGLHNDLMNWDHAAYDLRNPSISGYEEGGEITDTEVMTVINRVFDFNKGTVAQMTPNFEQYYDKINIIDYYLLVQRLVAVDCVTKNFIWLTYDGLKWFFLPYDLDTVFGLHYAGTSIAYPTTWNMNGDSIFWTKIYQILKPEIETRYAELRRNGIFTTKNVFNLAKDLELKFGQDLYKKEQQKWPDIPSKSFTSIQQICDYDYNRLTFLDTFFNYSN